MSRRTTVIVLFSALVLGTGACNSMLEPTGAGIAAQPGSNTPLGQSPAVNGPSADDPAGDDHGGRNGNGGSGRGGADDPANHQ